jgi:2-keto-4-pentenoate hydratase
MTNALTDAQVVEAADFLDQATAAGLPLPPIPESCRPQNAADGGRIYWERWSRNQRPSVAWKAAVLDGEMVLAPFFDDMVFDSPASIPGDTFVNCILEAEVAFRLGQDFAPSDGGHSEESVLGAVANAYIVIEAPNSRFNEPPGMPGMAADGVGNQALVIGPEIDDWQSKDLVSLPCQILINGEVMAEGRDERPNPIEILVATVNEINNRGMTVTAGEVITTGAAAIHVPGLAGQEVTIRFPGIGDVELRLT